MDLNAPLLLYCERLGPGPWAEPLNALSNLGYFWFAWKLASEGDAGRTQLPSRPRILAVLIALVGASSLTFHTLATRWANVLDIAAIGIFNVAYLVMFLRVIARWPVPGALAAAAGFVLLDRAAAALLPAGLLNGSGAYLPALATLAALTVHALRIAPAAGRLMLAAALTFLVALTVRTLDRSLCAAWPWGTHFIWHLLTARVLWQLARTLRYGTHRG